jgi:hypothetical protein
MVPALRPLGSLCMARGCARIDSTITPGCLQLLGYERRFHTAWVRGRHLPGNVRCPLSPQQRDIDAAAFDAQSMQILHSPNDLAYAG